MKTINADEIKQAVAQLAIQANRHLPPEVAIALKQGLQQEKTPLAQQVLEDILLNHDIARQQQLPLCQDTGTAVVFVELGQDVHIEGGLLTEAIQQGVAQGYREGYLRKSIVDALSRVNTGDNTPAVIHTQVTAGQQLKITLAPKGGGAENMSRLAMLKPSAGIAGIKDFVLETVELAGPNACPPLVIGIGIGGNFEQVALLAKKALLRPLNSPAPEETIAALERELLTQINSLGIGPQGFGGATTALAVMIESAPCHFASLPVAVNINCHVARHQAVIL